MAFGETLARAVLSITADTKEFFADLDKTRKKASEFGAGFAKLGKDFTALGTSLSVGVTAPIAAVVGGLATLTVTAAKTGDDIAKAAREAGLGAQSYQELTFAVGQVAKVSDEELTKAFGKLTLVIGEATQGNRAAIISLEQLGFTQQEIASGTITTEAAFERMVRAMQGAATEADAMTLAGDLMGDRLGPKLAGALRTSGDEIGTLRQQFRDLGLGMSDEALAASEEFNDGLDLLTRQVSAISREIGIALLPVLNRDLIPFIRDTVIPIVRDWAARIGDLIQWFQTLSPEVKALAVSAVGLAAALGPVLIVVGQVVSGFGALLPAITGVVGGVGRLSTAFVGLSFNPVVLGIGAIAAAAIALKLELDKGTQSMRDFIARAEENKTLMQAWAAVYGDTSGRLVDFSRLTAEQKAALLELAKGVQENTGALGGLKLNLEQAQEGMRGTATATGRTREQFGELRDEQQKYAEDVAKFAAQLSGADAAARAERLADAIAQLGGPGNLAAAALRRAADEVKSLTDEGVELSPILLETYTRGLLLEGGVTKLLLPIRDLNKLLTESGVRMVTLSTAELELSERLRDFRSKISTTVAGLTQLLNASGAWLLPLQEVRKQFDELGARAEAAGFRTRTALQKTADDAKALYNDMVASGRFSTAQLKAAWDDYLEKQAAVNGKLGHRLDEVGGFFSSMADAAVGVIKGWIDEMGDLLSRGVQKVFGKDGPLGKVGELVSAILSSALVTAANQAISAFTARLSAGLSSAIAGQGFAAGFSGAAGAGASGAGAAGIGAGMGALIGLGSTIGIVGGILAGINEYTGGATDLGRSTPIEFPGNPSQDQIAAFIGAGGSAEEAAGALDTSTWTEDDWAQFVGSGIIPMAQGGMGRVFEPTLFLAGEAGPEDVAFSGAGRTFSSADVTTPRNVVVKNYFNVSAVDADGVRRFMPTFAEQLKRSFSTNEFGLRTTFRTQVQAG